MDIVVDDVLYPSAEHYYQYTKAMFLGFPEDANRVLAAKSPYDAMVIGNELLNDINDALAGEWNASKTEVMQRTLELKYDSSSDFRDYLHATNDKLLVEATSHPFWASGLNPQKTRSRHPDDYPGQNQLGTMLMELRDKLNHLAVPINIPLVLHDVTSNQPSICDNPAYLAEELIAPIQIILVYSSMT